LFDDGFYICHFLDFVYLFSTIDSWQINNYLHKGARQITLRPLMHYPTAIRY